MIGVVIKLLYLHTHTPNAINGLKSSQPFTPYPEIKIFIFLSIFLLAVGVFTDRKVVTLDGRSRSIIYETQQRPEEAFSDGQQTLDFDESAQLIRKLKTAFELIQSF